MERLIAVAVMDVGDSTGRTARTPGEGPHVVKHSARRTGSST
jgi:hypothetical protein